MSEHTPASATSARGKPTPGPWRFVAPIRPTRPFIIEGATTKVAVVDTLVPYTEREANARLIAAAPDTEAERDRLREVNAELLEALEEAATVLETLGRPGNKAVSHSIRDAVVLHAKAAQAAIAKARATYPATSSARL